MARKIFIAGNWKMNTTLEEARALSQSIVDTLGNTTDVDVAVCPPYTNLSAVNDIIKGSAVKLGAQDVHWEESGAFTGKVSCGMLKSAGVTYVIIGHSERRQYFGETDETVNKKVKAALSHGLKPIICVGESLQQREAGETNAFVAGQVEKALDGLAPESIPQVVIAYEPIWAIGTGRSSSASDANEVIGMIRQTIAKKFDANLAAQVRIQYGGSVKPGNIKEFMGQAEIDGALVGGASLKAEDFFGIISY